MLDKSRWHFSGANSCLSSSVSWGKSNLISYFLGMLLNKAIDSTRLVWRASVEIERRARSMYLDSLGNYISFKFSRAIFASGSFKCLSRGSAEDSATCICVCIDCYTAFLDFA